MEVRHINRSGNELVKHNSQKRLRLRRLTTGTLLILLSVLVNTKETVVVQIWYFPHESIFGKL